MTASLALITCRFSITLYCYYLVSVASVVPGITLYECLASFVFFFFINHHAGFGRGREYLTHVSRNWNNPQVTSTEVNLDKLNAVFNTEKCKDPRGPAKWIFLYVPRSDMPGARGGVFTFIHVAVPGKLG